MNATSTECCKRFKARGTNLWKQKYTSARELQIYTAKVWAKEALAALGYFFVALQFLAARISG